MKVHVCSSKALVVAGIRRRVCFCSSVMLENRELKKNCRRESDESKIRNTNTGLRTEGKQVHMTGLLFPCIHEFKLSLKPNKGYHGYILI